MKDRKPQTGFAAATDRTQNITRVGGSNSPKGLLCCTGDASSQQLRRKLKLDICTVQTNAWRHGVHCNGIADELGRVFSAVTSARSGELAQRASMICICRTFGPASGALPTRNLLRDGGQRFDTSSPVWSRRVGPHRLWEVAPIRSQGGRRMESVKSTRSSTAVRQLRRMIRRWEQTEARHPVRAAVWRICR